LDARSDAKNDPAGIVDTSGPTQGGGGLSLGCVKSRIPSLNGKLDEELEAPSQLLEVWVIRQQ